MRSIFFVCIFAGAMILNAQETTARYPVKEGNLYGYIDASGAIVIKPQFIEAGQFKEGLAKVAIEDFKLGKMRGFVNPSGEMVIPAKYRQLGDFKEGRAYAVWTEEGKGEVIGFLDNTGAVVFQPSYSIIMNRNDADEVKRNRFSDGLFLVKSGHYDYSWLDLAGKQVVGPVECAAAGIFSEGFAPIASNQLNGLRWVYIDKTGEVKIQNQPLFEQAGSFSEGLAPVQIERKWGFVSTSGELSIPNQFDDAFCFSEGYARVSLNDSIGFIDKTGNMVIKAKYLNAGDFKEGLAKVLVPQQKTAAKWGYINTKGIVVIAPKYDDAYNFSNGLAQVVIGGTQLAGTTSGGQWGYINTEGKYVWGPKEYTAERSRSPFAK